MKAINDDKMKRIQLDILIDIHNFCEKNHIEYFLCGGSLIGAVRHRGMIPWDDDIDIAMTRPNYNRFLKSYRPDLYKLHQPGKDSGYLLAFSKVSHPHTKLIEVGDFGEEIGINIDIFPIDGLPNNKKERYLFVIKMKFLWGLIVCATIKKWSKRSLIRRFQIMATKMVYGIFPIKRKVTLLTDKIAQKYSFEQARYAADVVWGYGLKEIMDKSAFEPTMLAPFEDFQVRIPVNYDIYLRNLYGDYMKLPPESERTRKHGTQAHWIV